MKSTDYKIGDHVVWRVGLDEPQYVKIEDIDYKRWIGSKDFASPYIHGNPKEINHHNPQFILRHMNDVDMYIYLNIKNKETDYEIY